MITVSVTSFVDAIKKANGYRLPKMNEGTKYLYNTLYKQLAGGDDVKLSCLDFDAFEHEDINALNNLYSNVFERDFSMANSIIHTLHGITPMCKAVAYL
jgi:uncharacterized protein YegL